ncbi:GMC oxidoreductase family protein [Pleurotus pulmonarius]
MPLVSLDDVVNRKFDYIIVGGGTAGLVLAARLTEDDNTTVLVLEAGPANLDDDLILRPAQFGAHFGHTDYDWNFPTAGTEVMWHLGRGLGGSSATNYLCWTKPPIEDIDDFERLGNPGWNWKNHEKYLDKVENFIHVSPDVQAARGLDLKTWKCSQEGLLKIAHTGSILDIELKAHKAMNHLGIPIAKAPLHGDPNGTFLIPNNMDPATFSRTYTTNAYFLPNADRPNLSVLVLAHVNKILFEEPSDVNEDLIASGVEFGYGAGVFIATAVKEVILAATTVKSPQILELSGIGKREVLEKINVLVKVDLPGVGENLQEHVNACVSFEIQDNVEADTWDILQDSSQLSKHIALHSTGSGLFTTGISAVAFVPLDLLTDKAEEMKNSMRSKVLQNADTYLPGLLEQHKIMLERFDRRMPGCEIITIPKFLSRPNLPAPGKRYITFAAATNYNFSRGSVHCATSDPKVDPVIDPHYFEEEIDIQTSVEMVKFVRKLSTVHPFSEVVGSSPVEINPGPQVQTDEQISTWIKQALNSTFHPAGTCSMLPREKGGVVDPQLKVYGTKNVRVVDLSIVPLHFASHSQATVYAIAEQAAEIIRNGFRV